MTTANNKSNRVHLFSVDIDLLSMVETVSIIQTWLTSDETSWLCVAGDVNNLSITMREALSTPIATLQNMGEAACARVITRHNIDNEAVKLAEHFRSKSN